jgi:hypothetical protein
MKIKILLATMLLGLTGTAQVSADTLLIDEVTRNSADQADRPGGGLSMNDVEEKFGEPLRKYSAVGTPPITRWEYADYLVYFEGSTVLHSVRKHQSTQNSK